MDLARRGFLGGMFTAALAPQGRKGFSIADSGAVPDGQTMNTEAFRKAAAACSEAGGGVIVVPPGRYLTGPIRLGGNTILWLEPGALIQGSPRLEDYPLEAEATSGESSRAGLITFADAENSALLGRGAVDGGSMAFHDPGRLHAGSDFQPRFTRQGEDYRNPRYGTQHGPLAHGERPGNLVRFLNSRNVALGDGITIRNSPTWTIQFHRCQGVHVHGALIHSRASDRRIPNDDGIDIKECSRVRISDCDIDTGDDCIALFGSSEVAVSNCTLSSRSAGVRVGFAEGDIRACTFQNLTIDSNCGVKVNVRAGGSVEDVHFSGLLIRTRLFTGHWWGKGEPIHVSAMRWREGQLGRIRNVRFSNISAQSEAGAIIHGCPESVLQDIAVEGLRLLVRKSALESSYGGNFDLRSTQDLSQGLFRHDIPALYFRHVRGLALRDLEVSWDDGLADFFTHAIEGQDFQDLDVRGFCGRGARPSQAALQLRNGAGVSIRDCRAAEGTGVFLAHQKVAGRLFTGNDLSAAQAAFAPAQTGFTLAANRLPAPRTQATPAAK